MPTKEETEQLTKDTSKRGQPIPPDILEVAESIAGDTNEDSNNDKNRVRGMLKRELRGLDLRQENNSGQQKEPDANST